MSETNDGREGPVDGGRLRYLQLFGAYQTAALEAAIKMRDREHDNYWKRAAFAWGVVALAFGGLFALKAGEHDFAVRYALSCLCFVIANAWLCLNKGGAFIHDNWETHVANLEDEIIGPLYKTIMVVDRTSRFGTTRPFPFSPRRINNLLALVFISVAAVFVGRTAYTATPIADRFPKCDWIIYLLHSPSFLILSAITAVATGWLWSRAIISSPREWAVPTNFNQRPFRFLSQDNWY